MHIELKKAIVNFMLDNTKEFQLHQATNNKFRQYLFDENGNYCIGGEEVSQFIGLVSKNIVNFEQNFKS